MIEPSLLRRLLNHLLRLANEPQVLRAVTARAEHPPWRCPLFFTAWTVLAAGVAWWLIHSAGAERAPAQLLFDSNQASPIPVGEQIRRWLKIADLNFRGAYPWVLLAPYVLWLASRFLLERGRLRVSLPVHLLACALFAAASYTLTTHVSEKMNLVVVVADRKESLPIPWDLLTNEPAARLETTADDDLPVSNTHSPRLAGVTK